VVTRQLERAGYAAISASDGTEALELWKSGRFSLMLADIHMPRMDGYALTAAIRAQEQREGRARMPIIALTANVTKGEAERCVAAGMDDFLGKPVSIGQLSAKLRQWLPHVRFPDNSAVEPIPAAPPAPGDSPVDVALLEDIAGGDRALFASLLRDFAESTERDLASLATALDHGERDTVSRDAHRIKGAARLIGALALGEAAEAIERAARNMEAPLPDAAPLRAAFDALTAWMSKRAS
jgi:CheY-like chemotaxis protein/HPt (histidine-containing phosphotransfer) domain-containing protein